MVMMMMMMMMAAVVVVMMMTMMVVMVFCLTCGSQAKGGTYCYGPRHCCCCVRSSYRRATWGWRVHGHE